MTSSSAAADGSSSGVGGGKLPSFVKELIPAEGVRKWRLKQEMGALECDILEMDKRLDKLKETNRQIEELYMEDAECRKAHLDNIGTIERFTKQLLEFFDLFSQIMEGSQHSLFDKYRHLVESKAADDDSVMRSAATETTEAKTEEVEEDVVIGDADIVSAEDGDGGLYL